MTPLESAVAKAGKRGAKWTPEEAGALVDKAYQLGLLERKRPGDSSSPVAVTKLGRAMWTVVEQLRAIEYTVAELGALDPAIQEILKSVGITFTEDGDTKSEKA